MERWSDLNARVPTKVVDIVQNAQDSDFRFKDCPFLENHLEFLELVFILFDFAIDSGYQILHGSNPWQSKGMCVIVIN
jgi:hypothetical protein